MRGPADGRPGRGTPAGRNGKPGAGKTGGRPGDPSSLGAALSQLFTLKGYAGSRGDAELAAAWRELAGEKVADRTAVFGVNRGVLQVGVASAALLSELASFHKPRLVEGMQAKFPALKLRDVKFRLKGDLTKPAKGEPANGRESAGETNRQDAKGAKKT